MSRPKIVLYKAKTLKDGTHPVRLRLYFGKARYISLGYSCKENCWNTKANRFNKHTPNHREKNASLRKQELRAERILSEMAATEKPFSFQEFKRRFNHDDYNPTVIEFIEKLMAEMQQNGSIGNMMKYKSLRNLLVRFKIGEAIFVDIDYKFLKDLENFILSYGNKKSTAHLYMRTLRATVNEAIRRGYLDKDLYPFGTQFNKNGYSFSHLKGDYSPQPLSLSDIDKLKAFPIKQHPELEASYDIFMFLYRARGLNFIDLCQLTVDNISGDRLNYNRQKTGKLYTIKISPEMREIINKYKGEKYLFPINDTAPKKASSKYHHERKALAVLNSQLKEISEIIGLEKKITSYTARYSYTNILVQNNVSVPIIQQALGHSSIATTQHYIQKYSNEEVDKVDALV
ncbi:MAG: site-specific integrase [Bacteroidia bacterium]